jgi:hypothetical protein
MIIGSFNSQEGFEFDSRKFASGVRNAGWINLSQMSKLNITLYGFQPENLHVEKIGRKLWVTVLTKRGVVWTWSIGPRGKETSPNLDPSEAKMSLVEAFNTKA